MMTNEDMFIFLCESFDEGISGNKLLSPNIRKLYVNSFHETQTVEWLFSAHTRMDLKLVVIGFTKRDVARGSRLQQLTTEQTTTRPSLKPENGMYSTVTDIRGTILSELYWIQAFGDMLNRTGSRGSAWPAVTSSTNIYVHIGLLYTVCLYITVT